MRALEKLGYTVLPMKDLEPATEHLAIANGDATFMANHWSLLHADFYKNSGGDAKLSRTGVYADGAVQGTSSTARRPSNTASPTSRS
jgi:glycine betaine/proline transport system substrate-binding protein